MKFKRILTLLLCSAMISLSFTGCSKTTADNNSQTNDNTNISENMSLNSVISRDDMFTERDMEIGYDETYSTKIAFANNTVTTDGNGVTVTDKTITISDEGTYIISGSYSEFQIVVDAEKTDKIQLVLNNAQISNSSTAPIYVKQADKVFITLANGSENTLSVTGEFVAIDDNNIDAVIFSKSDLTLNGNGKLSISTQYGNAITSKDDLVVTSGIFELTVNGHGLQGKDSVRIANGDFTIEAGKDGIHSENNDDASLGFIYIANGTFDINSQSDGIDAKATLDIDDGTFTITTAGGSENAPVHTENGFNKGFGFTQPATGTSTTESTTETTTSTKGIKSTGAMSINGGSFNIDSCDDSIHSNDNVVINNGTFEILSGDDGMHADSNLTINGGNINIGKSYEGIEGQNIDINGGTIKLIALDDGLNAAGGNDGGTNGMFGHDTFTSQDNVYIKITGGKLTVIADGDGVDANGSLTVTGGETYVHGPSNSGNGALDYDSSADITGGIFVASGASGMAQNFANTSTQGSMLVSTQSMQSGAIIVKDASGKEIVNFTPEKQYNCVVISTPEIEAGKTYTVTLGDDTQTIEMTDIIYGTGSGMGGMGHGQGGQRPEGFEKPTNGQKPEGFQKPNGERPTNDGTQQPGTPPDGTSGATQNTENNSSDNKGNQV